MLLIKYMHIFTCPVCRHRWEEETLSSGCPDSIFCYECGVVFKPVKKNHWVEKVKE